MTSDQYLLYDLPSKAPGFTWSPNPWKSNVSLFALARIQKLIMCQSNLQFSQASFELQGPWLSNTMGKRSYATMLGNVAHVYI